MNNRNAFLETVLQRRGILKSEISSTGEQCIFIIGINICIQINEDNRIVEEPVAK